MISKAEIEHLKNLARAEFGQKETEELAKDLGEILGYVEQLREIDVSNVPEMTHALEGIKNVFRKDEDAASVWGVADLIAAFPEKTDPPAGGGHGTYLKVKAIL